MNFVSLIYIAFLLVAFTVYRLIPRSFRKTWLFVCCVAFCGSTLPLQTLGMLVYAWIMFFLGHRIPKTKGKGTMVAGIVFGVLLLYSCKYLNFTLSLLSIDRTFKIIAPIGISYIVFQGISYLAEVRKGTIAPVEEPLDLFIYLLFFPKVQSGPIEPPDRFLAELTGPSEPDYKDYLLSFSYILNGYVRKMVVADFLAVGVDSVYGSLEKADRFSIVMAAVMYSFQIYFDFSGYTDIAIGSAGLFGIRLSQNFDRPYLATGIRDFWKRWHMSLSTWLMKYIYIPLGGSRKGKLKKQVNTLITFAVSGLWHGASLTYLIWGMLHGLMQVVENLFSRKDKGEMKLWSRVIRITVTFALVTVAWIFFRIPSLAGLVTFARSFAYNTPDIHAAVKLCRLSVQVGAVVLTGCLFSELTRLFCIKKPRTSAVMLMGLADAALILVSLCFFPGSGEGSSFIYFNF
ncbi:MAG: hypothetical protein K6G60_02830 [Lachnospiraceae bacterium]|nr:hypothetical protein [Lachnospiraceae bacterium]